MPTKAFGALRTLVLIAEGGRPERIATDTLIRGIFGLSLQRLPTRIQQHSWARRLFTSPYQRNGYLTDWSEAVLEAPELDAEAVNVNDLTQSLPALRRIRDYDAVVIMHSALGDFVGLLQLLEPLFHRRRGPLFAFVGNEYDLMPQKFRFLKRTGAEFVGSQLPLDVAEWLYAPCAPTKVIPMPHALNPKVYGPAPLHNRAVEVGFMGSKYPLFIGDEERNHLLSAVQEHAKRLGMGADIRFGNAPREEWARFLGECSAVIGAEAGTYFLDREGDFIERAKRYAKRHPVATVEDIKAHCLRKDLEYRSGKAISSRHLEPIGTMTCQLLLEGRYNDLLQADQHYFPIRRGLGNLSQVLERLRDRDERARVTTAAHQHVMEHHTHAHRVRRLVEALGNPRHA